MFLGSGELLGGRCLLAIYVAQSVKDGCLTTFLFAFLDSLQKMFRNRLKLQINQYLCIRLNKM